jgi:hypothetical protein
MEKVPCTCTYDGFRVESLVPCLVHDYWLLYKQSDIQYGQHESETLTIAPYDPTASLSTVLLNRQGSDDPAFVEFPQ